MANQPPVPYRFPRRSLLQAGLGATVAAANPLQPVTWAETVATLAPPRAPLGLNLAAVRYWMTERPFNNLFLASSPPVSLKEGGKWDDGGPLLRDRNGWITEYTPGQHSAFLIDLNRAHKNTTYEILYTGAHQAIQISGGKGNTFAKTQEEARMLVRVRAPIRNVIVREQGLRNSNVFATRFVERCQQFRALRFMDWLQTNEDRPMVWEERVTKDYCTQAEREVALEYLHELCSVTKTAMWYCIHHRADDAYVRNVARTLRELGPLPYPIYLEHSNEVWNGGFRQHHFCREQNDDWLAYHSTRTGQIAEIFRDEKLDVIAVLGMQSAHHSLAKRLLRMKLPSSIQATAIAPYFGAHPFFKPDGAEQLRAGGLPAVMEACREGIELQRKDVQVHRDVADQLKLDLLAYEGGQHLSAIGPLVNNQAFVDVLAQANRQPEMFDFYRDYLNMWNDESGGGLMCLFNSVSASTKWGNWGLMEYEGQPIELAPKYRAVVDYLSTQPSPAS